MSEFNIDDILAEFRDGKSRKEITPGSDLEKKSAPKSVGATDVLRSLETRSSEAAQKPAAEAPKPVAKSSETTVGADDYDEYKPTEPLFSIDQLRKIEAQRKENIRSTKKQDEAKPEKQEEKKAELHEPLSKDTLKKDAPAEKIVAKAEAKPAEKADAKPVVKAEPLPAQKETSKPASKPMAKSEPKKPATIFGDIEEEEKKPKKKKEKASVNINPFTSLRDKISQHRFLFEELVKRDFKKKYKRTILGMLWSVISPLLTFLIQLFIFGSLFRRGDQNFVIYLLTGNLMFHFFSDTTTTGMFSVYANSGVLSKINAPKSVFIISSNVAGIFNFMLTLLVYFVFMIFTGVNFGPHLVLMIYPIVCMVIFNLGISYILSALFVFFRDIQYLYTIAVTLLMYMSGIFYYADSMPENIQFVFAINPVYRYIAYMRQLVIDSIVPNLTSHLICLGFAVGALLLGYMFHKKTEKNFVYYY